MSACTSCGACCSWCRVDFSSYELDEAGGTVPSGLAVEVNGTTARMRGTDDAQPRCRALRGRIGEQVSCFIYDERPDPCREFEAGSEACLRARRRHGLAEVA